MIKQMAPGTTRDEAGFVCSVGISRALKGHGVFSNIFALRPSMLDSDRDLPLATELWGNPEVTARIGGPFTQDMVHARLAAEISQTQECGLQYWPIFLLDSRQDVGCAGLRPYRLAQRVYELGVHLRRAFWKRGLAKEAAHACIDYAFGTLGAEALFAGHHPANEASRQLLLKLGFVRTHEELYPPTGLVRPSCRLHKA
jgi:ribosomal-protein-alanine N-acetyltransferase